MGKQIKQEECHLPKLLAENKSRGTTKKRNPFNPRERSPIMKSIDSQGAAAITQELEAMQSADQAVVSPLEELGYQNFSLKKSSIKRGNFTLSEAIPELPLFSNKSPSQSPNNSEREHSRDE